MAYRASLNRKDHSIAALFTLGVLVLAVQLLIMEVQYRKPVVLRTPDAVAIRAIPLPAPPPPVEATKPAADAEAGRASAQNIRSKATALEAPKPVIPPPNPPDITAAPKANSGADSQSGAAPVAGLGTGAGGTGDGTGSGGAGQGSGSGGGTRPIWQSGTIRNSDYPRSSAKAQRGGEVETRFTIQPNGRVTGCRISRSSGDGDLDATTCRLIEQRFIFRPATNAAGEAIASSYGWRQSYWLERGR